VPALRGHTPVSDDRLLPCATVRSRLPSASLSVGQAFFTEDPRTNVASSASGSGAAILANPLERSHAYQLVLDKEFSKTDARVTLSRTTTTATLAKIDPDNGSAEDLGAEHY
jgi:hypothetical protein